MATKKAWIYHRRAPFSHQIWSGVSLPIGPLFGIPGQYRDNNHWKVAPHFMTHIITDMDPNVESFAENVSWETFSPIVSFLNSFLYSLLILGNFDSFRFILHINLEFKIIVLNLLLHTSTKYKIDKFSFQHFDSFLQSFYFPKYKFL